ncbi:MAG TPA: type II toxin-antitoxin system death-on-curing family toxin [Pyrinomonadaceae bacterium]|nr:type II toxin-antitoxin system death-on-curing family toxin [Pyrinomonadaceae bacterium]
MAIDETVYISYAEAVLIHIRLLQALDETRYGVDSRELIESALNRPKHAAIYENADIIRQSANLLFGLIKNHPWRGGNKRTATTLLQRFLELNGYRKNWTIIEQIELVLTIESDAWKIDEIEIWLRERVLRG